jgi:hypothetical protein
MEGRMAKLTMKEILEQVLEFVDQASSNGIRYSEIQHKIQEAYPGTSPNSIQNRVHYLKAKGEVVTPSRGLYVLKKFADDDSIDIGPTKDKSTETGEPKEATTNRLPIGLKAKRRWVTQRYLVATRLEASGQRRT